MSSTATKRGPRRWGRRGLLKGFGAGALGTAAVVFGTPGQASAHYNHYECCHLVLSASSYSRCADASSNYIWGCSYSGQCRTCTCCEALTPYGTVWASAYSCANYC